MDWLGTSSATVCRGPQLRLLFFTFDFDVLCNMQSPHETGANDHTTASPYFAAVFKSYFLAWPAVRIYHYFSEHILATAHVRLVVLVSCLSI